MNKRIDIEIRGAKGAGKTTVLNELGWMLREAGFNVECLDDGRVFVPRCCPQLELKRDGRPVLIQTAAVADDRARLDSLLLLINHARRHLGTSGGRVCATLLASLYNGDRVKLDVSDLRRLDTDLFEAAMDTIRLCVECNREPHEFIADGGAVFEKMIADWGLEKKRRRKA